MLRNTLLASALLMGITCFLSPAHGEGECRVLPGADVAASSDVAENSQTARSKTPVIGDALDEPLIPESVQNCGAVDATMIPVGLLAFAGLMGMRRRRSR